jgi:hypothetical protein
MKKIYFFIIFTLFYQFVHCETIEVFCKIKNPEAAPRVYKFIKNYNKQIRMLKDDKDITESTTNELSPPPTRSLISLEINNSQISYTTKIQGMGRFLDDPSMPLNEYSDTKNGTISRIDGTWRETSSLTGLWATMFGQFHTIEGMCEPRKQNKF